MGSVSAASRISHPLLQSGCTRSIESVSLSKFSTTLNTALVKHDPKARAVNKIEDFAYIKDATALVAFQELGMIDKGEKATLAEALDLRNRCGHPSKYAPGPKKASSFVEDVVGIVFT